MSLVLSAIDYTMKHVYLTINNGDTVRVLFTGTNGTTLTVMYKSQTHYLQRPGTQQVDLTYTGGYIECKFYPSQSTGNNFGVNVNPSAPTDSYADLNVPENRRYLINGVLKPSKPIYLEQLYKLRTNAEHVYYPKSRQTRNTRRAKSDRN